MSKAQAREGGCTALANAQGRNPGGENPPSARSSRRRQPTASIADPLKALRADALVAFRRLRRKHGALWGANPKQVRRALRKAQARVFKLKRGPKPDPRIAEAAHAIAQNGARVEDLFDPLYKVDPELRDKNPALYAEALDNFRRKVNLKLSRRRRRKEARRNRTAQ